MTPSGPAPLSPPFILNSRFEILSILSAGAMGRVYRARDNRLNNIVAIKEMITEDLEQLQLNQAKERFDREAKLLAHLHHRRLPRVTDYFLINDPMSRVPLYYLVMTFIEGRYLETLIANRGRKPFPVDEVMDYFNQILTILNYLHQRQPPVLHRDIKPSNIMLHEGKMFLIDFGIARTFAPQMKGKTIGTPGYAAPEQFMGTTEPRSDIFSLGAVIHYLLTGKDPTAGTLYHYAPIRGLNPSVPEFLDLLIHSMLEIELYKRPATKEEILSNLRKKYPHLKSTGTTGLKTAGNSAPPPSPTPVAQQQTARPSATPSPLPKPSPQPVYSSAPIKPNPNPTPPAAQSTTKAAPHSPPPARITPLVFSASPVVHFTLPPQHTTPPPAHFAAPPIPITPSPKPVQSHIPSITTAAPMPSPPKTQHPPAQTTPKSFVLPVTPALPNPPQAPAAKPSIAAASGALPQPAPQAHPAAPVIPQAPAAAAPQSQPLSPVPGPASLPTIPSHPFNPAPPSVNNEKPIIREPAPEKPLPQRPSAPKLDPLIAQNAESRAQAPPIKRVVSSAKTSLLPGKNIHAQDSREQTQLKQINKDNSKEIAELLISLGADVHACDRFRRNPVHFAHNREIAAFLFSMGSDIQAEDQFGRTPLHYVQNREMADFLINNDAKVHAPDKEGRTPLHWACFHSGSVDVLEFLICKGADANARDEDGKTPLHWAGEYGHKDMVELLICHGADIDAKNRHGITAIDLARIRVQQGNVEFLSSFSSPGIKAKYKDIFDATRAGSIPGIHMFLQEGDSVNERDAEGRTPLDLAPNKKTAMFLLSRGADIHSVNKIGRMPIHCPANIEVAEYLVAEGADINSRD